MRLTKGNCDVSGDISIDGYIDSEFLQEEGFSLHMISRTTIKDMN